MLIERDREIPRADAALIVWQRMILVLLLLAVLGLGAAGLLVGEWPADAPPTITALDHHVG